jgi:hypothetical protein
MFLHLEVECCPLKRGIFGENLERGFPRLDWFRCPGDSYKVSVLAPSA